MELSNDFIRNASEQLSSGDFWLTRDLELREKDPSIIRCLKTKICNVLSLFGFEHIIGGDFRYYNISIENVLTSLRNAEWSAVDSVQIDLFFRSLNSTTHEKYTNDINYTHQRVNKTKVSEKFLDLWTQRERFFEMLDELPFTNIDVTISEKDFNVCADRTGRVHVYDAFNDQEIARIVLYNDGQIGLEKLELVAQMETAELLNKILFNAHSKLAAVAQRNVNINQFPGLSNLLDIIFIKIKNPNDPMGVLHNSVEQAKS